MPDHRDHPDPSAPSLVERAGEFIDRQRLLGAGERVVVALSGGCDSVALLAVLRELAQQPGREYVLSAAHLHHGLRSDADSDAAFVERLCGEWNVPLEIGHADVRGEAERRGAGIEETGRAVRYAFLRDVAHTTHAAAIATAHHADDNVETILHRILRGTHLRGLAGIPVDRPLDGGTKPLDCVGGMPPEAPNGSLAGEAPQSAAGAPWSSRPPSPAPSGSADGAAHARGLPRLIRPLLFARRGELEAFCREQRLLWCEDATNADPAYDRNYLRHELLPLLRERISPGVDDALLRLAHAAAEAEMYIESQARDVLALVTAAGPSPWTWIREPLRVLPSALLGRCVRAMLADAGTPLQEVGMEHLDRLGEALRTAEDTELTLPGAWRFRVTPHRVEVLPPRADVEGEHRPPLPETPLRPEGRTDLPDGRYVVVHRTAMDRHAFAAHCRAHPYGVEFLDADRLRGPLRVRSRCDGDAFRPLGAPGGTSVSDFLTNLKLPPRERSDVLCLCDDQGIAAVLPLRIDERVKVTGETRTLLRVTVIDADAER